MRYRRPPDDLFNWAVLGGALLLVVHSARRHRAVFALTWLAVVVLSVGSMLILPRTYEVQATVQIQRAPVLTALGGTASTKEADPPTKIAGEMVLRHENLVALIEQTDLLRTWFDRRAPVLRLKDSLYARLFPRPTDDERVEAFVGLLEDRLWVSSNEGVVTIGIHFSDPQLAFQLVDGALENFLEARHTAEVTAIGEEITILESRADNARSQLEKSVEDLQALRSARASRLGRRPVRLEPLVRLSPDERLSQLQGEVETKRRAIADLEEFRRHRITQLETTLQEQKALYADNHPLVQDTRQSLEAVRRESSQIQGLRRELASLESELKKRGEPELSASGRERARDAALKRAAYEATDQEEMEDPDIEYAKSKLRHRIKLYNGLLERIEYAHLHEDTARAAFKYRYSILRPPQRPSGPVAPRPTLVITSSVLAGFLLGLLGTAFLDVSSRKVLEPWQVEHALGVPLLGVVRLP